MESVLTVCDGIGAVHEAWKPLGWTFVLTSEIDAFPREVLAIRQAATELNRWLGLADRDAKVPLWGDFTALRVRHLRRFGVRIPSVLAGGTPCQAFSVAGLRRSLGDARGNLTLAFVRLADAIDALRARLGLKPLVIVWENVPGVLSVKDNAFGCFLAGLVGADAPLVPGRGQRWTDSGLVVGPARTAAWIIRDAQYFGVAQRRRRVFVVASARKGFDPAAVLFEPDCLFRDSPPSREAGQGAAASLTASAGGVSHKDGIDGRVVAGISLETAHTLRAEGFDASEDGTGRGTPIIPVAPTLTGGARRDGGFSYDDVPVVPVDAYGGNNTSGPIEIATALRAKGGTGHGDFESETFIAYRTATDHKDPQLVAFQTRGSNIDLGQEVTGTIGANADRASGSAPCVALVEPIPFDTTQITHPENRSNPQPGDPATTLAKGGHPPTIAYGVPAEPYVIAERGRDGGHSLEYRDDGTANAILTPSGGRSGIGVGAIAGFTVSQNADGFAWEGEVSATLQARPESASAQQFHGVRVESTVRRLTPMECERLQGFRDGYTQISWKGRAPEECPDGPRYKALGNSMAVPVMAWLGERIALEEQRRIAGGDTYAPEASA